MERIDLYASRQELENRGDAGKIAYKLIQLEGRATWIPGFVEWLFENYRVETISQRCPTTKNK